MTTRSSWLILLGALLSACGGDDGGSNGDDAKVQPDTRAEVASDAVTPDAVTPDAAAPDAVTPDAAAPDAVTPDAAAPDNGGSDDEGIDTAVTPDTAVEAETHATPVAPELTSVHTGWKSPKCLMCHEYDDHNDGNDPYLCAGCHGTNGAPNGHKTGGCDCHAGEHGDEGFPSPLSCTTCHPK